MMIDMYNLFSTMSIYNIIISMLLWIDLWIYIIYIIFKNIELILNSTQFEITDTIVYVKYINISIDVCTVLTMIFIYLHV